MNAHKVVLIDAFNLAYRAQFRNGHLATSKGKPTGVIYSFLKMLHALSNKFDCCPVIVAWEGGHLEVVREGKEYKVIGAIPTWRKSLPRNDYKGNRKEITKDKIDLHRQIPEVQKMLTCLRYPQLSVPSLEADDLIGIAANTLGMSSRIEEVAIISSDKDFFQCIVEGIVNVYRPGKGNLDRYTAKRVKEEFDVTPQQWAVYKSFTGDSSDHYRGIDGIGPKKAAELCNLGADTQFDWKWQSVEIGKKFPGLKKDWPSAMDAYKLAVIPKYTDHKWFPKGLTKLAEKEFENFDKKLFRKFTKQELKQSIEHFTAFCSQWEMVEFLANKRKYFSGSLVDGEVI